MTHRLRCRRNLRRLPQVLLLIVPTAQKDLSPWTGQAGETWLLQDLWELLEVTTVANARVQIHHRQMTHRLRCRRNLRRLPQDCAWRNVSLKHPATGRGH
uniref:Uncharacterized protein n=1 Tax=Tanacetum cinerariifolium TaxID=118510 RepID=A0A699WX98_TANCI|nr:hypothetical protein [Tanacetum cinerariifolium]